MHTIPADCYVPVRKNETGAFRKRTLGYVGRINLAHEIERRKNPRREVRWPVTVLTENGTIEGETRDFAVDGISIRCVEPLLMNQVFRMGVMPPDHQMIEFTGKVIWSDLYGIGDDSSAYGMGVCFVEISDEDLHILQRLFR